MGFEVRKSGGADAQTWRRPSRSRPSSATAAPAWRRLVARIGGARATWLRRKFPVVLVSGATPTDTQRVTTLGHKTSNNAMEDHVIVKPKFRQVNSAGYMHRRNVREELESHVTHIGFKLPDDFLAGFEAH